MLYCPSTLTRRRTGKVRMLTPAARTYLADSDVGMFEVATL